MENQKVSQGNTGKYMVVSFTLSKDARESFLELAANANLSCSGLFSLLIDDFISTVASQGSSDEIILKDKNACLRMRIKDKIKIGLKVREFQYNELKEYAERRYTTIAEVARVIVTNYILKNASKLSVKPAEAETSFVPIKDNEFQMFIDLE